MKLSWSGVVAKVCETISLGWGVQVMPYTLLSFIFILFALMVAWFNRKWGIVCFSISLVLIALVFIHHISEHLEIYL